MDKNPLAVELAKFALWLESHAEGMPLTFLDHRLVVGDSLTGPFWDKLMFRPGKPDTPMEDLFSQGLYGKLQKALTEALGLVRRLESSVGSELADVLDKEAVKARLDQALLPFRVAVAAWAGGVMLGPDKCDDIAYSQLLKAIGHSGWLPDVIESDDLRAQIARGLGLPSVPAEQPGLESAVNSPQAVPALGYDLTFPEVFYPLGGPHGKEGFHAVLGNPPWDAIQFKSKEFFAAFDFEILNAPTKREREGIERRLIADPLCGPLFVQYKEDFEQQKRANDVLYEYQKVYIDGDLAGRQGDAFRVFMERNAQLLAKKGWTGVVVPSAFHANEGATGVRRLYLEKLDLRHCYSFENKRKLFEIHSSFKFATVVAQAGQPTEEFSCAFYLHDDEWLFGDQVTPPRLKYTREFVRRSGGEYLSLAELKSDEQRQVADAMFAHSVPLAKAIESRAIRLQGPPAVLHMSHESGRFRTLTQSPYDAGSRHNSSQATDGESELLLIEGKCFWHFEDRWGDPPRYSVLLSDLTDKPYILSRSTLYQLAIRAIASSTNERTAVAAILPPGVAFGHSCFIDSTPRAYVHRLELAAIFNSYSFDWILRQFVGANVSLFILNLMPFPMKPPSGFLAHSALRMACNHAGYSSIWRDQLGDTWREYEKPPFTWPVLSEGVDRWRVRSKIDAVVVNAYELSREQYAHILSTFNHKSYPGAPELCLAFFDELKAIGLDAFTKKHDPYWDIPLNENLPQPVIDLPVAKAEQSAVGDAALGPQFRLSDQPARQRAKRKR